MGAALGFLGGRWDKGSPLPHHFFVDLVVRLVVLVMEGVSDGFHL